MSGPTVTIPIPQKRVSCQQLLNFDGIVHHGILRKRTVVNKLTDHVVKSIVNTPPQLMQWPRRYVVIHEGCIYMYKEETSNKPAYAVSLYGYHSVLPCTAEVQGKLPWPFKVIHALNDKELSLYFSAPTERDMNIWVNHIIQQLIFANGFNAASGLARSTATLASQFSMGGSINDWSSQASTSSGESGGSMDGFRGGAMGAQRGPVAHSEIGSELIYMTDEEDLEDCGDYDEITEHGISKPMANLAMTGTGPGAAKTQLSPPVKPGQPPKPARQPQPAVTKQPPAVATKPPPPVATKPTVNKISTNPYLLGSVNESNAAVKPSVALNVVESNNVPACSANNRIYYGDDKTQCVYSTQEFSADDAEYIGGGEYEDMKIPLDTQHPDKGIENAYWRRSAEEADNTMKKIHVIGAYLVRASQESGHQTLLVKGENIVRKYKIRYNGKDGKYSLTSNAPSFDSLAALIAHYKVNNLPQHTGPLTRPYSTVWKAQ